MSEWKNMGDVNFVEHGGCLIKKESEDTYIVFCVIVNGEQKYAALCTVDLSDSWIDWKSIQEFTGNQHVKDEPDFAAVDVVAYYGMQEFNPIAYHCPMYPSDWKDFEINDAELIQWIKDIGAEDAH